MLIQATPKISISKPFFIKQKGFQFSSNHSNSKEQTKKSVQTEGKFYYMQKCERNLYLRKLFRNETWSGFVKTTQI